MSANILLQRKLAHKMQRGIKRIKINIKISDQTFNRKRNTLNLVSIFKTDVSGKSKPLHILGKLRIGNKLD